MLFWTSHVNESNLCLINIESYTLGSSFCHQIYQKGGVCIYIYIYICVCVLEKMYFTKALISLGIVKKKI